jgi:PEGA domain-containing protein
MAMLRPTRNLLAMRPLPVVVFALLTGIAPAAFAQSGAQGSEQSLAETLQGPASDAYGSARVLLNNKDYAGALAKYRQAYELSHDARLLFDMAICDRSLRAYAHMQSLLQQYEHEAGAGISQQDKVQVDDALAAIQNLVGTVALTVSEPDATVTLDGEPVGTTPLAQRIVIDLGTHKIGVTKPGFVPLERPVDVGGGSQTELSLTLAPVILEAHLLVTSDSDATVSIDGQVVGKARFDGPLAPGIHGVSVTEVDRLPYGAQIELRDGETRTMQVTLEREHHASLLPWLLGGAAVAAGAVVGGYFLFKSSDSGPALAPGKFGTVTFQ